MRTFSFVLCLAVIAGCTSSPGESDDPDVTDLSDLVGILITPDQPILPMGGTAQLKATGLLGDRTTTDLTAVVDWHTSDASIATVGGSLDEEGLITAVALGEARVWASTGEVQSPETKVHVTDAELLGLSVDPKEITVSAGDAVQLTAQAAWSDGTRADASSQVRWVTDNGDVATMDPGGVVTGVSVGQVNVHAEWESSASNTSAVTVVAASDRRADLEVGGLSVEAGGGAATVTVRVNNTGGSGASEYWVDMFLDPESPPEVGDYGDYFGSVEYTGPSGHAELPFSFDVEPGAHEIWVVVDSGGVIDEEDEGNNTSSQPFEEDSGNTGGPNMQIVYFEWIADETSIYYAVDVYNSGSEDIGEFFLDLYVDQRTAPEVPSDGDEYVGVDSLLRGDTTHADFLLDRVCDGCKSWVLADSYDDVAETNESDNLAGPVYVYSEGGYYPY